MLNIKYKPSVRNCKTLADNQFDKFDQFDQYNQFDECRNSSNLPGDMVEAVLPAIKVLVEVGVLFSALMLPLMCQET